MRRGSPVRIRYTQVQGPGVAGLWEGKEMRFFGFGKKRASNETADSAQAGSRSQAADPGASASSAPEIVVYGTHEGGRCRQVRGLLEKRGYVYKDVRVDEDLSTRAWLQRTTGDDSLPKVFIGTRCYGGFEDIQVLAFEGTIDRILQGEEVEQGPQDELAAMKQEMSPSAILTLLRKGEILTVKEGDMEMDAWAEPLANPPQIYYEGLPHPIQEMGRIVAEMVTRLRAGEIELTWKEED